jgi:undecaprenyl-diphosphatase
MIQDFWASLLKADQSLFELINGQWTCPFFDSFMPWMRTSEHWFPMYVLLLGYLFYKWGWKALKWILAVAITIGMSDQVSSFFFKPFLHRLRPCADPSMVHQVKLLIAACPTSFSFTSSHATNHFALAMFICMTLQPLLNKYVYLFFLWAAIISYAQIYVGVHYPLDVLAGSLIGITMGYALAKLYLLWNNKYTLTNQ